MKLHIVPASRGIQWVKLGMQTFFRQPLALSGLFFMFLAVTSVLSVVPYVGILLALGLLPGASLGLMAATREASDGRFPMPWILLSAFRAGRVQLRAMLVLGALYALGIVFILGCTAVIDGGNFATLTLFGSALPAETLQDVNFRMAMLSFSLLNLPLSLLFFHAAALVYWHEVPPVKGLFFAVAGMVRNFRAYAVFGLVWMGVFICFGIIMRMLAALVGSVQEVPILFYPAALLMTATVFTSIYFTFLDSFTITPGAET